MAGARVPLTMIKQQEELLSSLVGNITGVACNFSVHLSLKLLRSLSEPKNNKEAMFAFPRLMDSIRICSTHMYEAVREEAARIIMNLSMSTKNQAHIVQGNNQRLIDVVLVLARGSGASNMYAIKAFGYLASFPENKIIIVQHKKGAVIDELLRVASSGITQAQVSTIATRIIATLTCQATAVELERHSGLLITLSSLACRDDKPPTLPLAAALTIKKISTHVFSSQVCQALVTMSYARTTEVLKYTVKAYCEQVSNEEGRVKMIAQRGLLPALVMLANDNNVFVRHHAQEVLGSLSADVANAKNVPVEKVLRCVSASNVACQKRGALQPRCYSPSSIAQFDFDFAAF